MRDQFGRPVEHLIQAFRVFAAVSVLGLGALVYSLFFKADFGGEYRPWMILLFAFVSVIGAFAAGYARGRLVDDD